MTANFYLCQYFAGVETFKHKPRKLRELSDQLFCGQLNVMVRNLFMIFHLIFPA